MAFIRMSAAENPINPDDYVPIIIHYYDGVFGTLQTFGHIAIQIGRYYLTFEKYDEDMCYEFTNFQFRLDTEEKRYGAHSTLNLSDVIFFHLKPGEIPPVLKKIAELKNEFRKNWKPRDYKLESKNCADFTAAICSAIFDLANFDKVTADKLKRISEYKMKGLATSPSQVNLILSEATMPFRQEQISRFRKESESSPKPVKIFIAQLLNHIIDRLMHEAFQVLPKSTKQYQNTQHCMIILLELREKIAELPIGDIAKTIKDVLPEIEALNRVAANDLEFGHHQIMRALQTKDEKEQATTAKETKKDPVRPTVSPEHLHWLKDQIHTMYYWYLKNNLTDNLSTCQKLLIHAYQLLQEQGKKTSFNLFYGILDDFEKIWEAFATEHKTAATLPFNKTTAEFINNKNFADFFMRDVGMVMLRSKQILKHQTEGFEHLHGAADPLSLINKKLTESKYAAVLFNKLCEQDIPQLPPDLSTLEHLNTRIKQLQHYLAVGIISYPFALQELITEIYRATDFANKPSSSDFKYRHLLEKIKVDMVTEIPEPKPPEMKKAHIVFHRRILPEKILSLIQNAVEDKENQDNWKKSAIRKDLVILGDHTRIFLPPDVKIIYQMMNEPNLPAKKIAKITQHIQNVLRKPGCTKALLHPAEKPPVPILFLLGILALQQGEKLFQGDNAFTQLCNTGRYFLPKFVMMLKQAGLQESDMTKKSNPFL